MRRLHWLVGAGAGGLAACAEIARSRHKAPEAPARARGRCAPARCGHSRDRRRDREHRPARRRQRAGRLAQARREVLTFLELRPGMRVVDYFAAGGYYTELLSRVVGPRRQGHRVQQCRVPEVLGEKAPTQRYGNKRLPNVAQLTTPVEDGAVRAATASTPRCSCRRYHDLYWRPKDDSWPQTDPAKALAQLVPALKPGAVVVVVDHVANAGSDPAVPSTRCIASIPRSSSATSKPRA